MTILQLVVIIFVIGALVGLAQKSGWVPEPFLKIGTYVAVGGIILLILWLILAWTGTAGLLDTKVTP